MTWCVGHQPGSWSCALARRSASEGWGGAAAVRCCGLWPLLLEACGLHGGRDGRGDLLVQRPGLGLTLLLGLLAAALGLLLPGFQIGFTAVQDLLKPGQAHGGSALELQVVDIAHGEHESPCCRS